MNSDWSQACCVEAGRRKQRFTGIGLPTTNCDGSIAGKLVRDTAERPVNTTDSLVVGPNTPDAI